jgi:S-adenosylmethionine decarboxylase
VFGPHLIIDGSRCNTEKLADRNIVEQVLNEYPAAIGMTKIGGPYMFEYQAPDPAYSGVSGIVVIAESHIAIHTFPELDYFTMDIFSCKNFDHELAIDYIKRAFDVEEMDRMLVQRGLSFKGPHHGKHGATDELIAAAEARLAAGIVSKEPALPDEAELERARIAAAARGEHAAAATGHMVWPRYGVTPDLGTYGAEADDCESCARGGATVHALSAVGAAPLGLDGTPMPSGESLQVNPTASISGLLDKLSATAGPARPLGGALKTWETLARDPHTTIVLTLTEPVIAAGLRETLVYTLEQRYADVVIASADDLAADLYEALGYAHFAGEDGPLASEDGREAAAEFFARFLDDLDTASIATTADLWQALGKALPTRVPRKGLLQAAAHVGMPIFTPDLGTSVFGTVLMAARARGKGLALDPSDEVMALARRISRVPRLGIVQAGEGVADALLAQAREVAAALGLRAPSLTATVVLGAAAGARRTTLAADGAPVIMVPASGGMILPLIITGLAQRLPTRRPAPLPISASDPALALESEVTAEAEAALA